MGWKVSFVVMWDEVHWDYPEGYVMMYYNVHQVHKMISCAVDCKCETEGICKQKHNFVDGGSIVHFEGPGAGAKCW